MKLKEWRKEGWKEAVEINVVHITVYEINNNNNNNNNNNSKNDYNYNNRLIIIIKIKSVALQPRRANTD